MTRHAEAPGPSRARLAITVTGVVQGVGFRPFVERAALRHRLAGWVKNAGDAVQIEVEGAPDDIATFVRALTDADDKPPAAVVYSQSTEERRPIGELTFTIDASSVIAGSDASPAASSSASLSAPSAALPIPPDMAPCARCLAEIEPGRRRAAYPFTSCTACGPRYSIALGAPYDRARTTMAAFSLCDACRAEYDDAADHRCHAQTLSCSACGPRLSLRDERGALSAQGSEALEQAAAALRAGTIVAIKGVGGYQLLCDAQSERVTSELRRRKRREEKPFAVLFRSVAEVRAFCEPTEAEIAELTSPAAPIVLCLSRRAALLSPSVAMGSPLTGAMLPASPLHHLLAQAFGGPLVCTSGNLAGQPLFIDDDEAAARLAPIADVILAHDRPIARACDDSVVRVTAKGPIVLRRARGLVPRSIERPSGGPPVLALGGHLKSTVSIAAGSRVLVSQHIGDLTDAASVARLRTTIDDLLASLRVRPEIVACDLHPDYASTRVAEELAATLGATLTRVQHHHAHIAAVIAERGLEGPILGFAWDGTGDGGDGTIWGGEALLCEGASYQRVAHFRHFSLPGGDRAAREPRRAAAGVLIEIAAPDRTPDATDQERITFATMIARRVNSPRTSSVGRLFDAVAALVGLRTRCSYEGQAAMELEHAARGPLLSDPYPIDILQTAGPLIIDWEPALRALLRDVDQGVNRSEISRRFHASLADAAAQVARLVGATRVALSGGCFQNARLLEAVSERLSADGIRVYTAATIPPNDGGISLGQTHIASARATERSRRVQAARGVGRI